MKILLRSCGGLGNQIFQLAYARLLASKYKVRTIAHYHEANYTRVADWEYPKVDDLVLPNFFEKFILKLRLPKILYRIGIVSNEYIKFGNYLILDGYFQDHNSYKSFSKSDLNVQLERIRIELIGKQDYPIDEENVIFHFRLGDFFRSEEGQAEFVVNSLPLLPNCATLISNRDDFLTSNNAIKNIFKSKLINYIVTDNYKAIELIRLFSNYKVIYSNGSTLALWASILSNSDYHIISNTGDYSLHEKKMINFKNMFSHQKINSFEI